MKLGDTRLPVVLGGAGAGGGGDGGTQVLVPTSMQVVFIENTELLLEEGPVSSEVLYTNPINTTKARDKQGHKRQRGVSFMPKST